MKYPYNGLFILGLILLASCLKQRIIEIPNQKPDSPATRDSILPGAISLNEVNCRWGANTLTNELSGNLAKRFVAGQSDWQDGKTKWLELYNATNDTLELGNPDRGFWFLTDNPREREKLQINVRTIIPPKGFVVVYGSDTNFSAGNQIHTNFGIGRNRPSDIPKDTLILSFKPTISGRLITVDSLNYVDHTTSETFGRFPDGNTFTKKLAPTPKAPNKE